MPSMSLSARQPWPGTNPRREGVVHALTEDESLVGGHEVLGPRPVAGHGIRVGAGAPVQLEIRFQRVRNRVRRRVVPLGHVLLRARAGVCGKRVELRPFEPVADVRHRPGHLRVVHGQRHRRVREGLAADRAGCLRRGQRCGHRRRRLRRRRGRAAASTCGHNQCGDDGTDTRSSQQEFHRLTSAVSARCRARPAAVCCRSRRFDTWRATTPCRRRCC
jgi:hypothetical protein